MKSLLTLLAVIMSTVSCHSSGFFLPSLRKGDLPNPLPLPISYHIHVTFNLSDPTSLEPAIALRDKARAQF